MTSDQRPPDFVVGPFEVRVRREVLPTVAVVVALVIAATALSWVVGGVR